jgi:hypothetical protein
MYLRNARKRPSFLLGHRLSECVRDLLRRQISNGPPFQLPFEAGFDELLAGFIHQLTTPAAPV